MPVEYKTLKLFSEQELVEVEQSIKTTGEMVVLRVIPNLDQSQDANKKGTFFIGISRVKNMDFSTAEVVGLLREEDALEPYYGSYQAAARQMTQLTEIYNIPSAM